MNERRRAPRQRSLLGGRIAFNDRFSTFDCLVRNLSPEGAMLVFGSTVVLPNRFDLHIHKGDRSFRDRMVWRSETAVGVAFDAPDPGNVVSLAGERRTRMLEAETAALRRRVEQLQGVE